MKLLILPVIISTIIITQCISPSSFAASSREDCMASLFASSGTSWGAIDATCLDTLFSTTSSSGTTSAIATKRTSDIATGIAEINQSISQSSVLNAAPQVKSNSLYTPWELLHRTPMLAGFMWSGPISQYITPAMYIGTPFEHGGTSMGGSNPFSSFLTQAPTTYAECLSHEAYLSYGLGDLVESTDIKEFKSIAKACAKEYYGSYFNGKSYTTREEFLMMLFTIFEEPVTAEGRLNANGWYIPNEKGIYTHFTNVSPISWYAPYLVLAQDLGLLPPREVSWQTAREISDREAIKMLSSYTAYRMNFDGTFFDRGMITTEKMKYTLAFPSANEVSIKIQ